MKSDYIDEKSGFSFSLTGEIDDIPLTSSDILIEENNIPVRSTSFSSSNFYL